MKHIQNERGIALAVAIVALVVVGALVAGAFFVGMQEQRVGRNTRASQQAFSAAQGGAQLIVANWESGKYSGLAQGDSQRFEGKLADGTGWYRGWIRRLNDLLYIVDTEGFSRDTLTRQKVGLLVRLRPVEFMIQAALQTRGAIQIGGSSYISGYDVAPTGWGDCPALADPLAGIRIDDTTQISTSGCADYTCVSGDPQVEEDTTITDSTLTTFGDMSFDDLKSMANKFVPGGTRKIQPSTDLSGACDRGDLNNWGAPLTPLLVCGDYFPIIWSEGDLNINGVQGQGVLIVNGDLTVQGGFEFFGPVIVRGILKTTGTGGHFNGGVMASNIDLDQSTVLGDAVINFSSCALIKSLQNSAPGSLLQERSWVSLYN